MQPTCRLGQCQSLLFGQDLKQGLESCVPPCLLERDVIQIATVVVDLSARARCFQYESLCDLLRTDCLWLIRRQLAQAPHDRCDIEWMAGTIRVHFRLGSGIQWLADDLRRQDLRVLSGERRQFNRAQLQEEGGFVIAHHLLHGCDGGAGHMVRHCPARWPQPKNRSGRCSVGRTTPVMCRCLRGSCRRGSPVPARSGDASVPGRAAFCRYGASRTERCGAANHTPNLRPPAPECPARGRDR